MLYRLRSKALINYDVAKLAAAKRHLETDNVKYSFRIGCR